MAKKKEKPIERRVNVNAEIEGAGIVQEQPITTTLETNYLPYAMSVIISRALPEIDGFKPSHRKLLYTMYKMGLLTGARTKSANVVGQTMRLNPHGDAAIYETMVRLARGNECLLHPYIDSKGNFGKAYSRDMAFAASRYTEVKLDGICAELFRDIDKDTIDFTPNYDNTMLEPMLLPVTFPSILVNANVGIAVSMASAICPFNLKEVCDTTIALLKNKEHDIAETLKGPDFPGGGMMVYNADELEKIYRTGRGSVKVRARYTYDKENNCIEITEIPPTTTVEAIIDKISESVKAAKIREISDVRDETDLSGLKLAIDLKRGIDPDKLMAKLYRSTPLEDTYSCNFNILVGGAPQVMGVYEILEEWTAFRFECLRRRTVFDLQKKKDKLHLLKGLGMILLDIDKAIEIVRETEEEAEVVPNLMIGFGIDEVQAEYVAEIKLRNLNKEYILKRLQETDELEQAVADLENILKDKRRINRIMIDELEQVAKKYGKPRKTLFTYADTNLESQEEEEIPDYPVHLFLSDEGYFKKITPLSLRLSNVHKLKEGDQISLHLETTNNIDLLFFSDRCQVYKSNAAEFEDTKASVMGDYIPAKLGFDEGEKVVGMVATKDYSETLLFFFENGKVGKVPLKAYETKTKRKKLANAYSDKSALNALFAVAEDRDFLLTASSQRKLLFHSAVINLKTTRDTQGVSVFSLKKGHFVESVVAYEEGMLTNPYRYRTKTLPSAGMKMREEDLGEQLSLI